MSIVGWSQSRDLTVVEFKEEHEKNLKRRFVALDIEVDRVGRTFNFGGVLLKSNEGFVTEMKFGMNDLMSSNFYGEMADRDFRLIDFEAYEADGKTLYGAIRKSKVDDEEVRFYRELSKEEFGSDSAIMEREGFRLADIEGYSVDGDLKFACEWVILEEKRDARFAHYMLAVEFYQKNASMMIEGCRLTDIEAYLIQLGELRYAGSRATGEKRLEA